MSAALGGGLRLPSLAGSNLEITERGSGAPLLFLHSGHPTGRMDPAAEIITKLAQDFRVIVPTHPGFGRDPAPANLTTVDDLAYLYLDLLDAMDLSKVILAGVSFGAWIAAEMAVKSTQRLCALVLGNPVGIKVGGRESRDIVDIYSIFDKQIAELAYADAKLGMPDRTKLSEDELTYMAKSRESTARYGWSPYLHNPKLKGRLHRIRIPTLILYGAADRILAQGYGRAFAAAIPGAQYQEIAEAGHFPHLEQPELFARHLTNFVRECVK
jgi:pimeloyl-ACP methyl ester carboxylesterase